MVIWLSALLGIGVGIAIPLVVRKIVDGPIATHDLGALPPLGVLALALGVADAVLIFLRRWTQTLSVLGAETAIRDDLYRHLQLLPMSFHGEWRSGQSLSRATADLSAIRRFFGFGLLSLITSVLQAAVVTAVVLATYWPLGLLVAFSIAPVAWLSVRFERGHLVASRRAQDQQGDLATLAVESLTGIRTVKAFGRRAHVVARYERAAGQVHATSMDKVRLSSRFATFLEVIPNVTLALVLLLGGLAVGGGALTLGTLVALTTLVLQLVWPVTSLGHLLAMAQEAMTSADRVVEVLDTRPAIVSGPVVLGRSEGHVRFEGVEVRLPGAAEPVLRDLWLDVRPGETVAIVGATGSGKTTLTSLVPRLLDVTGGRVTIDGHDVRDLTLPSLRAAVATAFQDPTLFSVSVRENLTIGRPDAGEDEIREALETARATFAYELPDGLGTRVGERGMSLSGGQRQRLALARAVLGAPGILVLDDTLSALDADTVGLVERALRGALGGVTTIAVTHRASTVLLADRVALLSGGTITHVGGHGELFAGVPEYRELLREHAGAAGDSSGAGRGPR